MGVRPPQSDAGGPDPVEFGIPVLTSLLDDAELAFPATDDAIVKRLDDPSIPIDAQNHSIRLSTALAEIDRDEFESQRQLVNALHPVFEARRERLSTGILGSIRALFPF